MRREIKTMILGRKLVAAFCSGEPNLSAAQCPGASDHFAAKFSGESNLVVENHGQKIWEASYVLKGTTR
jgi:hypothetical protein